MAPPPYAHSHGFRGERWWVALLALIATYGLFCEYLPPFKRVHLWSDIAGYHYPLQRYAFDSLKEGRIPQWDASIYCGISFAGNVQAAFLYPPTWLMYAAVWKLPVVFVCENNLYMEYTPIKDVIPIPQPAADRASAYGLERILIDGNSAAGLGAMFGGPDATVYLLALSGLFMSVIYPTLNSKGISCFPKAEHGAIAGVILFFTCGGLMWAQMNQLPGDGLNIVGINLPAEEDTDRLQTA